MNATSEDSQQGWCGYVCGLGKGWLCGGMREEGGRPLGRNFAGTEDYEHHGKRSTVGAGLASRILSFSAAYEYELRVHVTPSRQAWGASA